MGSPVRARAEGCPAGGSRLRDGLCHGCVRGRRSGYSAAVAPSQPTLGGSLGGIGSRDVRVAAATVGPPLAMVAILLLPARRALRERLVAVRSRLRLRLPTARSLDGTDGHEDHVCGRRRLLSARSERAKVGVAAATALAVIAVSVEISPAVWGACVRFLHGRPMGGFSDPMVSL